jgi:hypothetical protein
MPVLFVKTLDILTAFSTASAPELKNAALQSPDIGTKADNLSASSM